MENEKRSLKRRIYDYGLKGLVYFCAFLTVALLVALLGYILIRAFLILPGICSRKSRVSVTIPLAFFLTF